jgi:threonine/homoserine/homoserine lactone efflux protein
MLSLFVFGVLYAFAAVAQPGPFQTYVISQALSRGWRRTLSAAFAPLLSDGPIAVLMLLILSQLPGWTICALQVAGGFLLLYLAWGAFKAWREFAPVEESGDGPAGMSGLLKATLVNLLNPNPYLGWSLVMGPNLVRGWSEAPVNGIALLAGFYGTLVTSTMGIIVAAGTLGGIGPRVRRALLGLSALALVAFAAYALWSGASGWAQI